MGDEAVGKGGWWKERRGQELKMEGRREGGEKKEWSRSK